MRRRKFITLPGDAGTGLRATGYKWAAQFREARKIVTIRPQFGLHLGNPG
jgi:hypothetical protein